ncbi:chemotaxis protein CheW [Halorhabdus sp. CBA1104]|jgi:purine-binding chemotaxis protein CheW|uniref:chemotaxis protein CheW n=1 Tax=Halorhabdus sp. CBA1104 TaxID=1380432 RepID=UPI0012B2ACA0|nr:chemotaxis protein CheW [Halorhabdus sp. CBA1104]QGN06569.1 chemotaxis protein CheW [Halorhabdus sp. CBA1104]
MTATTQVVEFSLNQEQFCISLEHVVEIVEADTESLTTLPDSPRHVEGILDLRGETTTIINPKQRLDVGDRTLGNRILVLEADGETDTRGWIVDSVTQVSEVENDIVGDPDDAAALEGIVNRDEEILLWVDPDLGLTTGR